MHTNLREFLERSGERQQDFAKRVGVSSSYVSRLASGRRTPSLPMAVRIADAANIPLESLLETSREAVAS